MVRSLFVSGLAVASAQQLSNWESHGEILDEAVLSQPVLKPEMYGNQGTWVAGPNKRFEGMTLKQAKGQMGLLQNTDPSSFAPFKAPEVWVEDLPEAFDWRTDSELSAKCPSLKEVRDQAECGSCWAFSATEVMTDRLCVDSKGADTTHLSAQDVTSCCGVMYGDMGCNGGVPETAFTYFAASGVVDGGNYGDKSGCYSYQLEPCAHHTDSGTYRNCTDSKPTPLCARKCVDNGKEWGASKKYGTGVYSICPQSDMAKCSEYMMQDLYQNGPISVGFFVRQSFENYKSGVYEVTNPMTDPMLGGHGVKIVGYGTENGTPYWTVANSWNEDWGEDGFFRIKRGVNECNIENPVINGGPVATHTKHSAVAV